MKLEISRRSLFKGVSGVGLLSASSALLGRPADAHSVSGAETPGCGPIVETQNGKVRGVLKDGLEEFRGIPYGATTHGSNRFMPPQPVESWTGVREALTCGSPCPQYNPWQVFYVDPQPMSEDCLVLNVWSPADRDKSEPLPVMVWIHGGGFSSESGGTPAYAGDGLAKSGNVVVVSLNHRLNIFGYSYLMEGASDRFANSANLGHQDLVQALKWVRDNIEQFGGDPSNVTIFGESGGGAKVSSLIAMPSAQPLFHKAIVQSGSQLRAGTPEEGMAMARRVYKHLDVKVGDVEALQAFSTNTILQTFLTLSGQPMDDGSMPRYETIVDGNWLPHHPFDVQAPEFAATIPMMIGTTKEEDSLFLGEQMKGDLSTDEKIVDTLLASSFRSAAQPRSYYENLVQLYRKQMPALSPERLFIQISTDNGWRRPAIKQAELKLAAGGPPVFMYEFAWQSPYMDDEWAFHGIDLPYMLGHPDHSPGQDGDSQPLREDADPDGNRYKLADSATKAWAAFARTGNPSTAALEWPEYDLDDRKTMIFDANCTVVSDPRGFAREAMS